MIKKKPNPTPQIPHCPLSFFPLMVYISYSVTDMLNTCDWSYEIILLLDKRNIIIRNTVCRKHTTMNLLE